MRTESREKPQESPIISDFDEAIIKELQKKYQGKFDERNENVRKRFGDLFNTPVTAITVLESYFRDLELRPELLQDKSILDLGSASHFFDEYCQKKYNSSVVAIDINKESLGGEHLQGVVGDAKNLPFKDESFDLIISHASMPHVLVPSRHINPNGVENVMHVEMLGNVVTMLNESYKALKKGGQMRFSTFSEKKEQELLDKEIKNNSKEGIRAAEQQISRIRLVSKALDIFEKESGAKCMFKDDGNRALIIVIKT